jgi:guanine nucleotide-binding protein subunit beta-2-like 1 protein
MSNSSFILRGTLEGHNGWVTSLATCTGDETLLVSGSRDKSIVFWKLTGEQENYGVPVKSLLGHGHIVEDVVLTRDGSFAFSASWDKSAKIWNVAEGKAITTLKGHSSDVLSVSYNEETSQVITASRDKTIKVWSVHGECLSTLLGHDDWVTSAKVIVPAKTNKNLIFSVSSDKVAKVCNKRKICGRLRTQHVLMKKNNLQLVYNYMKCKNFLFIGDCNYK